MLSRISTYFPALLLSLLPAIGAETPPRIEDIKGKTILLFTPHPDDDAFCCGGTLALLAKNGNTIRIVIYTNDDKGSYDLEMTGERLARIRKAEEEEGNRILGIPKENLLWLGHHDGLLEYVDSRRLVEQATEVIRRYRPDIVMTVDPGSDYVRWHKTDHRMAAMNTLDAIRAAEFHLYFPNQRLQLGLEPWKVPAMMFFYVTEKDANMWVNIDPVKQQKEAAGLAHVSQWEPAMHKYRPDWTPEDKEKARAELHTIILKKGGHWMEAFRWATEFNQY
ncbi:PIG-L deacetylase family protein [Paludibaculum fermentans]|uniref:PIG-L family deacetylase n=1 Tax=Paludibaculum fermentans TaxID=1473598 RepID=A0A7S7SP11_PALFE|nr:PIG-L family deacetylase [Paludibaculum fermentans]QOY90685.1 PIG-L family deacetylase [Paludibaculum fermentans]